MRSRQLMVLLLVVLLAGVMAFAYAWFDTAVSLDYARQGQHYQRARERLLRSMLTRTVGKMSRAELVRLMKEEFGTTHIINEERDRLEVDDIVFVFKEEAIARVEVLGEEGPLVP